MTLFISPAYDYQAAVDTIRAGTDDAPLIGASSAGEFTGAGSTDETITISGIANDSMGFDVGLGTGLSDDIESAVTDATAGFSSGVAEAYPHTTGINLHDGLVGRGEGIAMVAYQHAPMSYVGGSAGDDRALEETVVIVNDTVASDAVALAQLGAESPFGQGVHHGHDRASDGVTVTEASGSTVTELDGRPAYDVWHELVSDTVGEDLDVDLETLAPGDEAFVELLTRFEFGIETSGDQYKIRWPGLTDSTDGRLRFATAIPEGTELFLMDSDQEAQLSAQLAACDEAADSVGGDYAGALAFNCICQADILGEHFDRGVSEMGTHLDVPLAGMEVYGEVGLDDVDMRGYHNATSAVLLLPE